MTLQVGIPSKHRFRQMPVNLERDKPWLGASRKAKGLSEAVHPVPSAVHRSVDEVESPAITEQPSSPCEAVWMLKDTTAPTPELIEGQSKTSETCQTSGGFLCLFF